MNNLGRLGFRLVRQVKAFNSFFRFIGHLAYCIYLVIARKAPLPKKNILKIVYCSGAKLAIPLYLFFAIISYLLINNSFQFLNMLHIKNQAIALFQNLVSREIVPASLAIFLCIHSALDMISHKVDKIEHAAHYALIEKVLPLMVGTLLSAILLYFYCLSACLLGLYIAYVEIVHLSFQEFLISMSDAISFSDLIFSIERTLFFASIASMLVAYYYYRKASQRISLRVCVSRIITRGFTWIAVAVMYVNLLSK